MKILEANIKIILDSRGKETLEAEIKSEKFFVSASAPSGESEGIHEAVVLEPKKALEKFKEIKNEILKKDFNNQDEFDNFLISLDAAKNKQNLGANLILSLSLAFARLKAKDENLELFQYIGNIVNLSQIPGKNLNFGIQEKFKRAPAPIFNVINGGAHSGISQKSALNRHQSTFLDFQEFQIIPEVKDFGMALGLGQEFYRKLKEFLEKKFSKENVCLGYEDGFSAPFENNEEAIEILAELIAKYNYPLKIGLDIAAAQFYKDGCYSVDNKKYSVEELKNLYLRLIEAYDILAIEDPFQEEAFDDFAKLNVQYNNKAQFIDVNDNFEKPNFQKLIITDDLTTTNPERLKTAIDKKSGNAIIIKPDQIGSLTEVLKVIQMAYQNNWQAIISHRSHETLDNFIADLAIGVGAWGLKSGAPVKPERMNKYNRVLEILKI